MGTATLHGVKQLKKEIRHISNNNSLTVSLTLFRIAKTLFNLSISLPDPAEYRVPMEYPTF